MGAASAGESAEARQAHISIGLLGNRAGEGLESRWRQRRVEGWLGNPVGLAGAIGGEESVWRSLGEGAFRTAHDDRGRVHA